MMKGNAGVTVINNVAFIFMPFGELVPETSHASLQKISQHYSPPLHFPSQLIRFNIFQSNLVVNVHKAQLGPVSLFHCT